MKMMSVLAAAVAAGVIVSVESASAACGSCGTPAAATAAAEQTVTTEGLAALLKDNKAVVVLDARAAKWDDGRRIGNAKSLNAGSTAEEIAAALPDKGATIVTYCAGTTCPASGKLAKRLRDLGYKNVIEYPEGIEGWTKAGNPVGGKQS